MKLLHKNTCVCVCVCWNLACAFKIRQFHRFMESEIAQLFSEATVSVNDHEFTPYPLHMT